MSGGDARLYAKFSLDFADSHKIAPLSDAAFRAYVRMVLWSRRMLTDGKIPGPMALVIAGKPKVLAELSSNDPVAPSLRVDENGDYWIHDFLEHQSSREQVEAKQAVNRANGAKGGRAKQANRYRNASEPLSESLSEPVANLYTESESETERPTELTRSGPVPETADRPVDNSDGLEARARRFNFDPQQVRRELAKVLDEIPDDDTVMRVATSLLAKASVPAKRPTAYIVGAIKQSEYEIQQLAYGGVA